ncbi:hypothetical protein HII31_07992 [Pseudocercospora fuligena]|uniref:Uncharacterized protein n=1 Tax=Pseudocercospora fuligena TaxID=685502 RepID=A0A8H6RGR9_9PEZI|nr:hypothetical protein HII31_07992 [Pseudocercospora fuligena]
MASSDSIVGLRTQIKANAAILFPSAGTSNNGGADPSDFQIIITKRSPHYDPAPYSACLVYGVNGCHTAAASRPRIDAEAALRSLLDVLSEHLAMASRHMVTADPEDIMEYDDGEIDSQMAVTG